jgi:hypothetical protein
MTKGIRAGHGVIALTSAGLFSAMAGLTGAPALAAPVKHPAKPAPAAGAPAEPQASWTLGHQKDGLSLSYGLPNQDSVIAFGCVVKSGDVSIQVPQDASRGRADQSQPLSLTIGGVRSSFAGIVSDDPTNGGLLVTVTVTARNPMFTALGGPGGLRIEGKGFAKNVPLRGIGEKLRQFLATCRK